MIVWLDFFLQIFVAAIAKCLAHAIVWTPIIYGALVLFLRQSRANRAASK